MEGLTECPTCIGSPFAWAPTDSVAYPPGWKVYGVKPT